MPLTALITLNAALGATVIYGLHHLLAYGIHSDRSDRHEVVALPSRPSERIAA